MIHWSSKLQKFFNGTNTTKIQRTAITFPRFNVFRSQWILWIIHIIRSFRTYIIRTDHKITIDSTFLLRNVRWNVLVSPKQPQISTLKSAYWWFWQFLRLISIPSNLPRLTDLLGYKFTDFSSHKFSTIFPWGTILDIFGFLTEKIRFSGKHLLKQNDSLNVLLHMQLFNFMFVNEIVVFFQKTVFFKLKNNSIFYWKSLYIKNTSR